MITKQNISKTVKEIRKTFLCQTQKELADNIGVQTIAISHLEKKSIFSIKVFFSILNYYATKGVSANDFFQKLINDTYSISFDKSTDNKQPETATLLSKMRALRKDTDEGLSKTEIIAHIYLK